MSQAQQEHNRIRMQLWCDMLTAVSASSNVLTLDVAQSWADRSLVSFDKRFPPPKDSNEDVQVPQGS